MKNCNQCGKCCKRYGGRDLSASTRDLEHWEDHRPDIFRYATDGKIWISPVTGRQMPRCPWLRKLPQQNKYVCRIYEDRPEDCRHYPVTIEQMVSDDCEMLEPRDLNDVKRAQRALDRLMADSRPALFRR